uniref:Immunoglobulin V-set domain-containing protein n=1 Tax=Labrus bergylta TaxID=56723 RepID=A0A3Q3GYR1_9LABR
QMDSDDSCLLRVSVVTAADDSAQAACCSCSCLFFLLSKIGDFPKYMWKSYAGSSENAPGISEDRFNVTINGKSVPLKIQKLQLTDSAVYYCALKPTVTGNTTTLSEYNINYLQSTSCLSSYLLMCLISPLLNCII